MRQLFADTGAHVLVDGQYGSTGKGLFASYLAWQAHRHGIKFDAVVSNAGPNSGHTFYHRNEKHVLKQLPTFAVKMALLGSPIPAYLSGGAIIDVDILRAEAIKYPSVPIFIHRNAAVVTPEDKATELRGSVAAVAGTRSGTGAALARRILREPGAIAGNWTTDFLPDNVDFYERLPVDMTDWRFFFEVSQGFSLGLLDPRFYPKVTSRECTVMQALADARFPAQLLSRVYMVARTYPIRVGDVDGFSSGDAYENQMELSWDNFPHLEPERTTVTNRVRRIFTFSEQQLHDAVEANRPDFLLMNFMNYLKQDEIEGFQARVATVRANTGVPFETVYGWGPKDTDITPF